MPKLFVALDLPTSATSALVQIQPSPVDGLRLAPADQMHATLHYIGEADVERIAAALGSVSAPSFSLELSGMGQFPSEGGSVTLWAGVRHNSGLLGLHREVGQALARAGVALESRPFSPHITLARCSRAVPPQMIEEFLAAKAGFFPSPCLIEQFHLYSSTRVGDVPTYAREKSFRLEKS